MHVIKDKTGKTLTKEDDIMERWKGHFEELLSAGEAAVLKNKENKSMKTKKIKRIREEELMEALREMKLGQASGIDETTAKMITFLSQEGIKELLAISNAAITYKEIPSDWKTGIILPIFKSGIKGNVEIIEELP